MNVFTKLEPLDPGKLLTTQIDNIFRPLRYPTCIFVPMQFGGVLNQGTLLQEKVVLGFTEMTP
jgi:hypothetical protein